jgi:hypothetical protein
MKLILDHTQRLNLHALVGAQRADVGSIHEIWAVQDNIALDTDEEKSIVLTRDLVNGQERAVWNPALTSSPKEFDFTEVETARIKAAIETWDAYGAAADRRWLEPLVDSLFTPGTQRETGN